VDRLELFKKPLWTNDVPTDAKEFYFIPRVFLMRQFKIVSNNAGELQDIVDIDLSTTPLYIADGQQVTMRIVEGKLEIRVDKIV